MAETVKTVRSNGFSNHKVEKTEAGWKAKEVRVTSELIVYGGGNYTTYLTVVLGSFGDLGHLAADIDNIGGYGSRSGCVIRYKRLF